MRLLTLLVITLLCLSSNTSFADIGKITEDKGSAEIERQKSKLNAQPGLGIESMDKVETANGIVGITFQDNTQVRVTEHSKLLIDDFVYDPNKKGAGKLALNVTMGTVRYASGNIAHENNKNVAINTPTASVAVRGTAFTMTVDEIGQSLVILLPNPDGTVGEIMVATKAGSVTLNRAFQSTVTKTAEMKPAKPIVLNLTESAINNMLIVSPPKEISASNQNVEKKVVTALDFNALDANPLANQVYKDPLAVNNLGDALNQNFLSNALDDTILANFVLGFNAITQISITDQQSYWKVTRDVKDSATVLINKDKGYSISIQQNGSIINLQNTDITSNNITIKQQSN